MSIPSVTKDAALNGITVTALSLHTAWPGTTGANEVTGGTPAYARKTVTVAASSGGQRVTTSSVTFDVPALPVRWLGMYNGSSFVGAMPNGGATSRNFVPMPSADLIVEAAHGRSNGDKVTFFNGTPPGGLTEGVVYFARDVTTDSYKVAATAGGPAIDLTASSSFGCVVCAITEQVYAAQDTHQVTTITLAVPD